MIHDNPAFRFSLGKSYDPYVPATTESTGCRGAAVSTAFLLGLAIVFMVAGLALTGSDSCDGLCETAALTMLYAGGPISGVFGVVFGGVVVAWPLEVTLWVALGFVTARWAENRGRPVLGVDVVVVLIALAYGLVLSQFVELAV